jgi:hypothetical protein
VFVGVLIGDALLGARDDVRLRTPRDGAGASRTVRETVREGGTISSSAPFPVEARPMLPRPKCNKHSDGCDHRPVCPDVPTVKTARAERLSQPPVAGYAL